MTNAKMREAFEQQFPSYSGTSEYELGYRKVWDAAYAAGRKAGMEEAAKVCDGIGKGYGTIYASGADDCAAAIRAGVKK